MSQFNSDNYIKFALITAIEGSWGFTGYSDTDGNTYKAIRGFANGIPQLYDLYWSSTERIRRVPKTKKIKVLFNGDEISMLEVDYIRNHPACEGSKNSIEFQPTLFKELDPIKDAQIELDRRKRRNDAVTKSLELEGKDLADMATMLGVFVDDPVFQLARVSEFANQDPEWFFKFYEDGSRPVKALIRKAIRMNKLKQAGDAIFWDKECIGGDENQAVSYLLADPEKMKGLEALVSAVPQSKPTAKKTK